MATVRAYHCLLFAVLASAVDQLMHAVAVLFVCFLGASMRPQKAGALVAEMLVLPIY